jgi:hypothetical protein
MFGWYWFWFWNKLSKKKSFSIFHGFPYDNITSVMFCQDKKDPLEGTFFMKGRESTVPLL